MGKYSPEQLLEHLEKALQEGEGTNYEFKENWLENGKKDIFDTVLAMSNIIDNEDDAFIFIGIKDNREIKGLTDNEIAKDDRLINHKTNYYLPACINTIEKDDKKIQVVSIFNRLNKPYFKINQNREMDGRIKIRKNSACHDATPEEIEELYKYRLRVDEDYLVKFNKYLIDVDSWKADYSVHTTKAQLYAFYKKYPNFRIIATRFANTAIKQMPVGLEYNGKVIMEIYTYIEYVGNPTIVIPSLKKDLENPLVKNICKILSINRHNQLKDQNIDFDTYFTAKCNEKHNI